MSRIDEITARLAAATPGPWSHDGPGGVHGADAMWAFIFGGGTVVSDYPRQGNGRADANADLIASAPSDLAWLVKELERHGALLRGEREHPTGPLAEQRREAESFAKYHDEHATHGGPSWEFHARAATFIRAIARRGEP